MFWFTRYIRDQINQAPSVVHCITNSPLVCLCSTRRRLGDRSSMTTDRDSQQQHPYFAAKRDARDFSFVKRIVKRQRDYQSLVI